MWFVYFGTNKHFLIPDSWSNASICPKPLWRIGILQAAPLNASSLYDSLRCSDLVLLTEKFQAFMIHWSAPIWYNSEILRSGTIHNEMPQAFMIQCNAPLWYIITYRNPPNLYDSHIYSKFVLLAEITQICKSHWHADVLIITHVLG